MLCFRRLLRGLLFALRDRLFVSTDANLDPVYLCREAVFCCRFPWGSKICFLLVFITTQCIEESLLSMVCNFVWCCNGVCLCSVPSFVVISCQSRLGFLFCLLLLFLHCGHFAVSLFVVCCARFSRVVLLVFRGRVLKIRASLFVRFEFSAMAFFSFVSAV